MSQDFFTRMIATNFASANFGKTTGQPKLVHVCSLCERAHERLASAEDCCQPEIFDEYQCQDCKKTWPGFSEAEDCCPSDRHFKKCPICLKSAVTFEDAADCCLFNHPTMTKSGRELMAEMVAAGTPWPEAIAANIHN